ncbi:SpoIIE family protein phosphatase [Victivallis sp. Marseille-Q1083]|uniref:SpoIIE family protein phosphatase n=1 Tax=Victivallis sp. Marseille-Q1083 TaxID=2717288 RepID=UPI00158CA62F|nr:SpoIIE family protein phosphatase [Victivallis sp. Marseille-Q1083]
MTADGPTGKRSERRNRAAAGTVRRLAIRLNGLFRRRSLVFKQCFLVIGAFTLVLGAILATVYYGLHRHLETTTSKIAVEVTDNAAMELDLTFLELERTVKLLVQLAENPAATAPQLQQAMLASLRDLKAEQLPVYAICIAFQAGYRRHGEPWHLWYAFDAGGAQETLISDANPASYMAEHGFRLPRETGQAVWIEPYYDATLGNRMMTTYSAPIFQTGADGSRRFIGIVSLDMTLDRLDALVGDIPQKAELQAILGDSEAFLLSSQGHCITQLTPETTTVGHTLETIFDPSRPQPAAGKLLRFPSDPDLNLSFDRLETSGWIVALLFPHQALHQRINEIQWYLFCIGLAGSLLVLTLVVVITRRSLAPLGPLAQVAERIGRGQLHTPVPVLAGHDEIATLSRTFQHMQSALTDYLRQLKTTTAAREKIESELQIARTIQKWLLPELQSPYTVKGEFSLFAELFAAKAVGGDLFDFFFLSERKLCFTIGDVSGKGVPAALFMAVVQTLHRGLARPELDCGQIMTRINATLAKNNEMMMFVTCFLATLDLESGVLEYCNAGHNRPLLRQADGRTLHWIQELHGPPLAISDHLYSCSRLIMQPREEIFLYTDGITEAHNPRRELFGEQRLQALLGEPATAFSPDRLLETVLAAVNRFAGGTAQFDDITMMAVWYRPRL